MEELNLSDFVSIIDAAKICGLERGQIRTRIGNGDLTSYGSKATGKKVWLLRTEVEEYRDELNTMFQWAADQAVDFDEQNEQEDEPTDEQMAAADDASDAEMSEDYKRKFEQLLNKQYKVRDGRVVPATAKDLPITPERMEDTKAVIAERAAESKIIRAGEPLEEQE